VGGSRVDADDHVHRLGGGEVVADRADAAKPLHDHRNFPQEPPADEPFEAAKLDDMQPRLVDRAVGIEVDRDLAMAFDPGDGRDLDQSWLGHAYPLVPQSNRIFSRSKPRNRPSSRLSVSKMTSPEGAQPGIL
jgi:hypothetical protein